MGIWIDESPLKESMNYISNYDKFRTNGKCVKPEKSEYDPVVIGHKLTPERMLKCHDQMTN